MEIQNYLTAVKMLIQHQYLTLMYSDPIWGESNANIKSNK